MQSYSPENWILSSNCLKMRKGQWVCHVDNISPTLEVKGSQIAVGSKTT